MTVYPLAFYIGPVQITGFGIMVMVAFLMGGWVVGQQLRERGLNDQYAWDVVVAAVIGGILGAKVWYWALDPTWERFFSRAGLVWYGGLFGGILAVWINGRLKGVPLRYTLQLVAPACAVGYGLGRVGCFLVQDDYGLPTTLPWGMKFPEGLPPTTGQNLAPWGVEVPPGTSPFEVLAVHPTQLYETAIMLLVFWILWRMRHQPRAAGWLFGAYMVLYGIERFLVEFVRAKDDRVLFGDTITLAQAASVGIILAGVAMAARYWREDDFNPAALPGLQPQQPPKAT
jgi:phosphatidylglycerol:prolipoprotein diacylglycerol transferase